jgi:hypothetical protein
MFVERIQPPGVRSTEFRTSLGSVALEFALLLDRRGMARLVAEVPAGAEAEVKQRAAGHPSYRLVDDKMFDRKPLAVDAPVSRPAAARPVVSTTPADLALANGWFAEDLVGTGAHGDPGPAGGVSATTGLNLGQMVMAPAPEGWGGVVATLWPWQVPGWAPPPNFKQPAVQSKVQPAAAADPVVVIEEVAAIVAAAEEAAPAPVKRGAITLPEAMRYEATEEAVNTLKNLWSGRGPRPSLAKVQAALQRNKLPPLSDDDETAKLQLKSLFDNLYP